MKKKYKELVLSQLTKMASLFYDLNKQARKVRKFLLKNPVYKSNAPDEIKAFMKVSYEKVFDIQLDCIVYIEEIYDLYSKYLRQMKEKGEPKWIKPWRSWRWLKNAFKI